MTLPLLDGDTLLIDNSRHENWSQCPRKGYYTIIRRRIPDADRAPLTFGGHLHAALKLRYLIHGTAPCSEQTEARQMLLLEKLWQQKPTAFGDHRTLGLAQEVISRYNETYGQEPFALFKAPTGSNIVEEPFAYPLGIVSKIKVVWTGVIDLPIVDSGENFVMDHKSTSKYGDYYFADFVLSSQFMGYSWVLREKYGIEVKGAMVNALIVRKPGKTDRAKDPIEFKRQKIYFDNDQLDEWRKDTLTLVEEMIAADTKGYFPKHTTQCTTKFGACPYLQLCALSPSVRELSLLSNEYKDDEWDPLHAAPEKLFLDVCAIPTNQLHYTKPTRTKSRSLGNVNPADYESLLNP